MEFLRFLPRTEILRLEKDEGTERQKSRASRDDDVVEANDDVAAVEIKIDRTPSETESKCDFGHDETAAAAAFSP